MSDKSYKLASHFVIRDIRDVRYFSTEKEREKAEMWGRFPHIRPDSTLVAAIGNKWSPGAYQRIIDMVYETNKSGICCWFTEIPDTFTSIPYMNIEKMRDEACLYAHNVGVEWMLMVENDILVEPDLIRRLQRWDMPVVVPFIENLENKQSLAYPHYKRDCGLKKIQWAVHSCLLIWTKVFNCFPNCRPFSNSLTESSFYNALIHYGHSAWQDTTTEVKISKNPTYHGGLNSLDELLDFWRETDKKLREPPDRKPIDLEDDREVYDR